MNTATAATNYLPIRQPFSFKRGGQIDELTLAYETWGSLDSEQSNAVLILTGLSPGAHAASSELDPSDGWWEAIIGPGKPIDTDRYFVICVNSLGSCKGSTGPASINPDTGQPYRLSFPALSIEDIAAAAQRVVAHLGIEQLDTLVGPSMGGMTALAYLRQFPGSARRLLSISSAAAAAPFAIAIRSLQREAICTDPAWNDAQYTEQEWPENGMRTARKLGMISYRSASEWLTRFGRKPQDRYPATVYGMQYEIESYLESHARKFIGQFDPCCYIYLSRAMDWFDGCEGYPDLTATVADYQLQQARVIGVDTDILFPFAQQQAMAEALQANGVKTDLIQLPSVQGHDAFLVDFERFEPAIGDFFQGAH